MSEARKSPGRERWDRVVESLRVACVPASVSSRSGNGYGVSYFISIPRPGGGSVEVHDKWWHRNPNVWIGYEVHAEDAEGIVQHVWPITKNRAGIVSAVKEAMA